MTQPTVIFFGPDGGQRPGRKRRLKVFLRTLLYSTSRKGQTIESLHVNLERVGVRQNFSIWVYGDQHLARGSGLFVGEQGITCNHHFLLPEEGDDYSFLAADYVLHLYAKRVRDRKPFELASIPLKVSAPHAEQLGDEHVGLYFDWSPDQQSYYPHLDRKYPETSDIFS